MTYRSLPVDDFGYRPQINFGRVGSDISQFAFKRPEDSQTPKWNISRYLPTTTRGLTKNSKNFQAPLCQVWNHIVSDPLEYVDTWRRYFDQDILCCLLTVSCAILNQTVLRPSDVALQMTGNRSVNNSFALFKSVGLEVYLPRQQNPFFKFRLNFCTSSKSTLNRSSWNRFTT